MPPSPVRPIFVVILSADCIRLKCEPASPPHLPSHSFVSVAPSYEYNMSKVIDRRYHIYIYTCSYSIHIIYTYPLISQTYPLGSRKFAASHWGHRSPAAEILMGWQHVPIQVPRCRFLLMGVYPTSWMVSWKIPIKTDDDWG